MPASVRDQFILERARILRNAGFEGAVERLLDACRRDCRAFAPTVSQREQILRVLDDAPAGLTEPPRHVAARVREVPARGIRVDAV